MGMQVDKDALKSFADITGEIRCIALRAWADGTASLRTLTSAESCPGPFHSMESYWAVRESQIVPKAWLARNWFDTRAAQGTGMIDTGISLAVAARNLQSVEILLDGSDLCLHACLKQPGDRRHRTLTDGGHTLTATVALRDEHVEGVSQSITFTTRNFWELRDDFTAPKEMGGWFGAIDLSQTIEESAGWQYSTGREDEFLGDDSRKVRQANTTGYLVWETPLLGEFSLALYAKETALTIS